MFTNTSWAPYAFYTKTNSGCRWIINTSTSSTTDTWSDSAWTYVGDRSTPATIPKTGVGEIDLPDGAKLVYNNGNYHIEDKDAKITYRANRNRAFNRYVNASDLLEEFLLFLTELDVKQSAVLNIPIDIFIHWLIMRAAQYDGEPIPDEGQIYSKLLQWQGAD